MSNIDSTIHLKIVFFIPNRSMEQQNIHKERKFIVFESQLMSLFNRCLSCGGCWVSMTSTRKGTMIRVRQSCDTCEMCTTWDSQPFVRDTPAGNVLMSASILFAGGSIAQVFRVLSHMGVSTISQRTYFKHQKALLFPAVKSVFDSQQSAPHWSTRPRGNTIGHWRWWASWQPRT